MYQASRGLKDCNIITPDYFLCHYLHMYNFRRRFEMKPVELPKKWKYALLIYPIPIHLIVACLFATNTVVLMPYHVIVLMSVTIGVFSI